MSNNVEDKWTQENLTAFKYALEGEISRKYNTQCQVQFKQTNDGRCKNLMLVYILTGIGQQVFELWQTNTNEVFWDYNRGGIF